MRWTAFDQETAAALAKHVENVEVSRTAADEVESALEASASGPAALVMPAVDGEHTLLATFKTREERDPAAEEPMEPSSYEAGGFLGLADEPVYEEKKRR